MFLLLSPGRPRKLGLPTVVCVECLPAHKPWGVVSATRRSSGVAPRACARVRACDDCQTTSLVTSLLLGKTLVMH